MSCWTRINKNTWRSGTEFMNTWLMNMDEHGHGDGRIKPTWANLFPVMGWQPSNKERYKLITVSSRRKKKKTVKHQYLKNKDLTNTANILMLCPSLSIFVLRTIPHHLLEKWLASGPTLDGVGHCGNHASQNPRTNLFCSTAACNSKVTRICFCLVTLSLSLSLSRALSGILSRVWQTFR